jgi:hypothetical protein
MDFLPELLLKTLLPSSSLALLLHPFLPVCASRARLETGMETARKCRACGRQFRPDSRNRDRQSYCSRPACQQQRRASGQRQRRQRARSAAGVPQAPTPPGGPQWASVISEADIRLENPVIIGLISMITGLTSLEEIQKVYRQLWLHGKEILAAGESHPAHNPAIINLLRRMQDLERGTG